ncbi:hypothetical protein [Robertkochia sediminum]|uniref:hypothetical protein n=1 Tax=Robertkochia sediminum TaxID=2785326 RepID=UPI001933C5B4|nr:hypothetical protein [Robertkochia sediminum]MBL7471454.1 hypothetical protein [Robertkochia sediminum]
MKTKSLIPVTVLVFSLVMVFAHLGKSGNPDSGLSRWVNTDRSISPDFGEGSQFNKVTDTVMASGFKITSKVIRTQKNNRPLSLDVKSKVFNPEFAVYDTLLDFRYRERELLRNTSLKALALKNDGDDSFWNLAGLTSFEIDQESSTSEWLYCHFSYRNIFSKEQRDYVLIVDREGHTQIEQT